MSNLELLKKLIKIESISPNDNGCFDVIKQQFDGLDFSFEETNYKNISNLIITNGDSKNKTFCFLGHTAPHVAPVELWISNSEPMFFIYVKYVNLYLSGGSNL